MYVQGWLVYDVVCLQWPTTWIYSPSVCLCTYGTRMDPFDFVEHSHDTEAVVQVCWVKTRIYPHASPILYHINLDRRSNFFGAQMIIVYYSYDMLWLYTHHFLNCHPTTSSKRARGAQLMDAGFINFLPGTHVEVNISMGYKDESSWPQRTQMANLGTLWLCQQFAIENGHRNSWFTHEKWWFSIVM